MRRFGYGALVAALLGAASASLAQVDIYWDPRLPVNAVSSTEFEVIEARGAGPADFWCAAGRYAEDVLGQTRGRIYVQRGWGDAITAPGRKGVVFTTTPPAERVSSYALTVKTPGFGLFVTAAQQYCRNYIIELEDRSL